MDAFEKMRELNEKLIEAADAYYNTDKEIMSNFEYDKLYDELVAIEEETGISLSNSITQRVGAEVVSSLKKSKHKVRALSLAKTKSIEELESWIGNDNGCLSWKLDGLTVVLTYKNGELFSAVTRGDGEVGEDITKQARFFSNIPLKIPFTGELIVRGEAVITYDEFNRINSLADEENKFKNPRNLVSGTVKNLNLEVLNERKVSWVAFTLVEGSSLKSYNAQLDWLETIGFEVVEHILVEGDIESKVNSFADVVKSGYKYPVDGLVVYKDDIDIQNYLGESTHHPNYAMAFKWSDETKRTVMKYIEWSKSRTGRINPVAILDPVELEGTTVSRASLHNLTYIEDMKLAPGDEVSVYKANMIIPQIAENFTNGFTTIEDIIPEHCPICGHKTTIKSDGDSAFLFCENKNCGDGSDSIYLFMKTLKIKHIAKKTIDKLVDAGILTCREDIFYLKNHKEEFSDIDGLGEKAFNTYVGEIEDLNPTQAQFLSALGVIGISEQNAKNVCSHFSIEDLFDATKEELISVDGIGASMAGNIASYFEENAEEIESLMSHISFKEDEIVNNNSGISGKVFAITGSVEQFKNRKEVQEVIEKNGAKLTGISSNTDYLITNDPNSGSSKNKKARELGIKIITEQELIDMIG